VARGGKAALCHVHAQIFAGYASDEFVTGERAHETSEARARDEQSSRLRQRQTAYAGDRKAGAGSDHDGCEAHFRTQRRALPRAFRSSRITVDDDLLAEGAVGVQHVSQSRAGDQDAEDDQSGGAQQAQHQHGKQPDQEDRQQRQHNERLGASRAHGSNLIRDNQCCKYT